jgi:hypothetical protein
VAARCCPPGPRAKFLSFSSVSRFAGQEKIFRSKIEQRVSLSVRILWELKRNWDQEEFGAHLSADLVETELKPQSGNAVGWDASACTTAILTGQRGSSHIETGAGILGKMPMEQNLGATIAGSCIHPATNTWPRRGSVPFTWLRSPTMIGSSANDDHRGWMCRPAIRLFYPVLIEAK